MKPTFRRDLEPFDNRNPGGNHRIILKDPVTERFFRVASHEYEFLRLLDGTRDLASARERFRERGYDISEADALEAVQRADRLGLVQGTPQGTAAGQLTLRKAREEARRAQRASRIYFLFLPLFNPDRFLERTLGTVRLLVNRWTAVLIALLAPGALYLAVVGFGRMQREYLYFFNGFNLLCLWITVALTKLVHELSHAYVAKSYGLRVPQMGVAFLIFFPCMYCDTTDAWQLASRRQRIAVSAAGIVAEGVLAVLATWVWSFSRPGLVNSVAFYMMAISFLGTVLGNGNPLIKFDGYFILSDLVRIPNLASKASGYLRYLFLGRILGDGSVLSPVRTDRERLILFFYGSMSAAYRVLLYTGIVGGIYYRFDKMIGALLAGLALGLFIVRPLLAALRALLMKKATLKPRPSGILVLIGCAGIALWLLLLPLPLRSSYPCFVDSDRAQKITIPLRTSVTAVYAREGMRVEAGQRLFELDPRDLQLALRKARLDMETLEAEYAIALLDEEARGRLGIKQLEIYQARDDIARIEAELARAAAGAPVPFPAVITRLDPAVQPGFRPGEGAVVGELESEVDLLIRCLVPGRKLHRIGVGQEIEVWLPLGPGSVEPGRIIAIGSHPEEDLGDSPFSSVFGGELATEVLHDQGGRVVPLEAQYVCTAVLTRRPADLHLGMTGRLAVPHPPRSLLRIVLDAMFRTFNQESLA